MNFKRLFSMLLCLCLVMTLFTGLAGTASADENVITHVVKSGDYLFKICKSYGLDYYACKDAIKALNGFTDAQLNNLSVNQVIKLPATNALAKTVTASTTTSISTSTTVGGVTTTTITTSSTAGTGTVAAPASFYLASYTVKSGDNLDKICNALGSNYYTYSAMILAMNGIKNATSLWAGKTVLIPVPTVPASGYAVVAHTVKSGESASSICGQYGVNYLNNKKLVDGLNTGKDLNKIFAGQVIYVPTNIASVTPAGTPTVVTPATSTTPATSIANGYDIIFADTVDGAPYATVNEKVATRVAAGSKVHIVGNPALGFAVKSVNVVRKDSKAKVDIDRENLTFIMPDCGVTVTVTYSGAYKVLKGDTANGKFSVSVAGSISSYANYGDYVTVTAYPDADYAVRTANVAGQNRYLVFYQALNSNLTFDYTNVPAAQFAKRNADGTFSFTMPNYDIRVGVVFAKAQFFNINTSVTPAASAGVSYEVNGIPITKAAANTVVTAKVSPAAGYSVAGVDVIRAADGTTVLNLGVGLKQVDANTYSFTMPVEHVIVRFNLQYTSKHVVHIGAVTGAEFGNTVSFLVQDQYTGVWTATNVANTGDTVRIVPSAAMNWIYSGVNIKYANSDAAVSYTSSGNPNDFYHIFTMPNSDVVVNVVFTQTVSYKIYKTGTEHGNFEVYVFNTPIGGYIAGDSAAPTDAIEIRITPEAGYIYDEIFIYDANGATVGYANNPNNLDIRAFNPRNTAGFNPALTGTLNLPGDHFNVKVTFKQSWKYVNIAANNAARTVNYNPGNVLIGELHFTVNNVEIAGNGQTIRSGSKLLIRVPEKAGYTLSVLSLTVGADTYTNTAGQLTPEGPGVFGWVVNEIYCDQGNPPANTITVAATYVPTEIHNILLSVPTYSAEGTYVAMVGGVSVTTASNEQVVTLAMTPGAGKTLDRVMVNDVDVTDLAVPVVGGFTYNFTMGLQDVKTEVVFRDP